MSIFPQSDVKVTSSGSNYTIVEFRPIYSDTSIQNINNIDYRNTAFRGGVFKNVLDFGAPLIPVGIVNLGVPSGDIITIQVINYKFNEINGRVKPIPYPRKKDGQIIYEYNEGPGYYQTSPTPGEDNIVTFGEYGISRGLGVQSFLINAVQFKSLENRIKLLESVTFRVNYSGSIRTNSATEDELLDGAVINYSQAKYWISKQSPKLNKVNIESSKLATGKWFRFEAPEEGIYKITKSQLSSIGLDPTTFDPRTIKIYNNGGFIVPEKVSAKRPKDLVENAILVVGEEDGVFNDADYVIFYGRGVNFWYHDTVSKKITRASNPYSFENYYWITAGGTNGKRIEKSSSENISNPTIKTTSFSYTHWDVDKINIGKSGRLFLGDDFSSNVKTRTYTTKLDGYIPTQPIKYNLRFVNNSSKSVPLLIEESSTSLLSVTLPGYGNDNYTFGEVFETAVQYNDQLTDGRSVLKFTYSPTSASSYGYLDYFEILYKRELKADNQPISFYSDGESGTLEYRLYNFANSDIYVYNVSDFANVKLISNPVLLSGGEYRFQVTETTGNNSKYIALLGSEYKTPKNYTEIKNQDIRGFAQGSKFIIITHKDFFEQAERLKKYRETQSKVPFTTTIYTPDEIYNEFSGGNRDISGIRDFIKYAYDNWETRPGYVLFFGDGDYDYRNIEGIGKNFVPTYETVNSDYELTSFCMDDFFGYVDGDDIRLDLALGRLNIQTLTEASNVVNKIIDYEQNSEFGTWRNLITLVADDQTISSGYDGAENNEQSEDLANYYIPKSFDMSKIYLVNYPTVQTSLGRRKPAVNQAIIDAVNNGTLLLNFIGHGSPEVWTHEQVFVRSTTIPQFTNINYFFLTAATCDFGYFDNPNSQSATEELMLKANSGSIGAFTSTRPVFSYQNAVLNQEFYSKLLTSSRDTMNFPFPVGRAYFQTKYVLFTDNDQKYTLFGDPTLRLNIPHYQASIDTINGQSATINTQLKALSKATLKGTVRNPDNTVWQDFSGEGLITVFDSERKVPAPEVGPDFKITMMGGIIFKGRISISNGIFSSDFVIPKDISYENKNGKIVLYIFNNNTDGVGYNSNVIIGGSDSTNSDDGKGPVIEIAFDDASNISGYLINPNSKLIVKLSDETGLNTTGAGVGHKLQGILNEDDANPIDLTGYFSGDLDAGGKTGMVNYRFSNLPTGNHQISVKAWDVFNNFSTESAYFKVVAGNSLVIDNVYNYPNPFKSNTTFTFQHNIPTAIRIKVKIYTISGRLINDIENQDTGENRFVKIDWDGRDKDGSELANGTYLYKLIVESDDGKFRETVLGKLVKMN